MATSKNSKTGKTATPNTELQDAVRPALVAELVAVAGKTAESEFSVWRKFADLAKSGDLSVNGFKAHLAQATEQGAEFATLKAGHAQHLVLMLTLSELADSPRNVARLYTLADRLVRSAPETKGVSKSETARKVAETAKSKGAKFGTLDTKTPKQTAKRDAHHNSKVESVKVDVKTIETLEKLVTELDASKISPELVSALIGLGTAIEVKFA
jgi:chemotaxis protein histidine kinase CheA